MGAYRLVRPIGHGSSGDVWLAEHAIHGTVAWKRATSREARAASTVTAPGLVRIVEWASSASGDGYLAMELVEGEPLDTRLRRVGRLGVGDALATTRTLAEALGALHARGIVHRDVKPENIVIGARGATLVDFGSAQVPGEPAPPASGTPAYMAPEQARAGARVDARADVYALGCVVFAMLVGRPPFEGTRVQLLRCHATQPAPLLSRYLRGVSPALEAIVAKCLDKRPEARFANGGELAAALAEIADHAVSSFVTPRLPTAATTLSGSAFAVETPRERHRMSAAVIGVVLIAASTLALVTGVRIANRRSAPSTIESAAAPLASAVGVCTRDDDQP